jgi:hypothetical protein
MKRTAQTFEIRFKYEMDDSTVPTEAERAWAASNLRTAYRAVHNSTSTGVMDMATCSVDDAADWNITPKAGRTGNLLCTGSKAAVGGGGYKAFVKASGGILCNTCIMDDDDATGMTITKMEKDWIKLCWDPIA